MTVNYNKTMYACFVGYIAQAIVNNFAPLLFLTFHREYQIELTQITLLVTINFAIQLMVDILCIRFVDKVGYRFSLVLAHILTTMGLIALAVLPDHMQNPYLGLLTAVVLYAVGGGLLEVIISPVIEACPTDNKEKAMSLLHSFYCWGHVGVVAVSTLFFSVFGIENWKMLAIIWAIIPFANMLLFLKVPIPSLIPEGEEGMTIMELFTSKVFWLFFFIMLCAGACEQGVSQWASALAEQGLGVSKTVGDIAGPMFFATMMGISRVIYGKIGEKIPLSKSMMACGALCLLSYLLISLSPVPALSLLGCGICGFSVGILWPGALSMASRSMPLGGTALFAILALGGDVGCSGGPTFVGLFSGMFGDDLNKGVLCGTVFPILLLIGLFIQKRQTGNVNDAK